MALLIEDPEIEAEILKESARTRRSPEDVIRIALSALRSSAAERTQEAIDFLARSSITPASRAMTKDEEAGILGYGSDGLCSS